MEVNDKIFDLIIFFLLNCKLIAFNLLIINRGSTNFSSNGLLILKIKLDQFWLKIKLSFKKKKKKKKDCLDLGKQDKEGCQATFDVVLG